MAFLEQELVDATKYRKLLRLRQEGVGDRLVLPRLVAVLDGVVALVSQEAVDNPTHVLLSQEFRADLLPGSVSVVFGTASDSLTLPLPPIPAHMRPSSGKIVAES